MARGFQSGAFQQGAWQGEFVFPPIPPITGDGGSIYHEYRTPRDLEKELDDVLARMRRPQSRAKRKRSLEVVGNELRNLLAHIKTSPVKLPMALIDLNQSIASAIEVESGLIAFADWRALVISRINQAKGEFEAMRLMQEEEEAAMFMLMVH
jgi:hypothetical protein